MVNSLSKYKTLISIIVLLLITNIAMLVYFMSAHKKPARKDKQRGGFEAVLKKEVGFDDEQVKKFKALRETHWAAAKAKMEEMKQVKLHLFNLTKEDNVSDSTIAKIADSIASLQKQIEINSFRHFRGTREICRPNQEAAYDSLMKKIIGRAGHIGGKPLGTGKK